MKYLLSLLFFLLLSCDEPLIEKPADLIPQDKMVEMLYDIAIINASGNSNPAILEDRGITAMTYLSEKYEVDSLQFVRSDMYYASRPLEYEAIYSRLESRLSRAKNALEEARRQQSDSIRIISEEERRKAAADTVRPKPDSLP